MTRAEQKRLCSAIKGHDRDAVQRMLEEEPSLIDGVVRQPPRSDDGKSLLQIAIHNGATEIAEYLLDQGADVNFIEAETSISSWRMPVIQDALSLAIMRTRWCAVDMHGVRNVQHTKEESDAAFSLLKRMIAMGAELNAVDSKGNTTMERAVSQAEQIMPVYDSTTRQYTGKRVITDELRADLSRIFSLLFEQGLTSAIPMRTSTLTVQAFYADHPLGAFLTR